MVQCKVDVGKQAPLFHLLILVPQSSVVLTAQILQWLMNFLHFFSFFYLLWFILVCFQNVLGIEPDKVEQPSYATLDLGGKKVSKDVECIILKPVVADLVHSNIGCFVAQNFALTFCVKL